METKQVLFLTPSLNIGGEELSTLSLTQELIKRGYKIFIKGNKGPLYNEFINAGAKVFVSSKPYRRNLQGIIKDAKDIKKLLDKEEIKIIHSQSVLPTIAAFLTLRGNKNKHRLIFHERGIHEYSYPIVARLFNYMTDFVIANSDYEKNKLIKNGLKREHCIRIHNCINIKFPEMIENNEPLKEFGLDNNTKVIGTVGRLAKQKGHIFLLKAFKRVNNNYPETRLLIVGEGREKSNLERHAHALGISKKVIFAGVRRDLERIYPIIDIFVIPSLWEPFGNVALEAAASGKPVVATMVGGLPESVLDGETGILVPPENPDKLAEAILFLLSNPDIAHRMGKVGQERVKSYFTPERLGDEIEKVYEYVLSKSEFAKRSKDAHMDCKPL
jgi:glycosyltransferase involved in cell wall biosynthesis